MLNPKSTPFQFLLSYLFLLIAAIFLIILAVLIVKIFMYRSKHARAKSLVNPLLFFELAMITVIISLYLGRYKYIFVWDVNELAIYAFSYAVYFLYWILGLNLFLKDTIRLPKDRMLKFNKLQKFLLFLAVASFIFGFFLITRETKLVTNYYYFATISTITIISFVYYYNVIKAEKVKNASKLMKGRLDLFNYAIFLQIVISFFLLITPILEIWYLRYDQYIEFITFTIVNIAAFISGIIFYSSIKIPNWIRKRYNLTPARFSYIRKTS